MGPGRPEVYVMLFSGFNGCTAWNPHGPMLYPIAPTARIPSDRSQQVMRMQPKRIIRTQAHVKVRSM
jgi:hypothetical protein